MLRKSLKGLDNQTISRDEAYQILRAYLIEQRELAIRKMIDSDSFTTPAWSEFQAYNQGLIKALEKILTFIPDQGKND